MRMDENQIANIISEIDYLGNGTINYTEFLAATLSITLSDEILGRLFKRFDVDDTGFIDKENLVAAFARLGRHSISHEEVTKIIETHDINKDNLISLQEFKHIFQDNSSRISRVQLSKQDSVFRPIVNLDFIPSLGRKTRSDGPSFQENTDSEGE